MRLEIDELLGAMALRESRHQSLAVLVGSADEVVRHPNIERAMTMLREDVNVELPHTSKVTPYWTPGTSPGVTSSGDALSPLYPRPKNLPYHALTSST